MKIIRRHFKIEPVKRRQHLLFNLLNFLYFKRKNYQNRLSIESHPLNLLAVVPYIMFAEAYFFRRRKYFVTLRKRIIGIFALQEKTEALHINVLAVSPFYRKVGIATYILDYCTIVAGQLGKKALELSVLRVNKPALRLYVKYGFKRKEEKWRSLILRKQNTANE